MQLTTNCPIVSRGALTIWKLGHCPRARDAPWYLFHRLFLSLGKDTGAP
ncbi:unnamed protein product [Staurois parvus]|uniref:Uncharacterized protein n=1 Tax=Staurois parvus TaxID=386267 RepID=A0ABN9F8P4_9NEOB|nr:unnamed protein product [Staurois parvus]